MSWVRMRVASSDWCASRSVVSVSSTDCCASIHSASPRGPRSSRIWRLPGGGGGRLSFGSRGSGTGPCHARPLTSGLPLTMTSPMKPSSRVARSRRLGHWNSSGVWSMNLVV